MRHLLHLGNDIDYIDDDGFGALHHAVLSGFEDVVQLLLDAGADVNSDSLYFGTPLCISALKGRESIIKLLLKFRANVNCSGWACGTPLHCTVYTNGMANIAQILLHNGASLDRKSEIHLGRMEEFAARGVATSIFALGSRNSASTLDCKPIGLARVKNRVDLIQMFTNRAVASANRLEPRSQRQNSEQEKQEPEVPTSSQYYGKGKEMEQVTSEPVNDSLSRVIYALVLCDFHAERSDELEAKSGEAIIVIAQSHPVWFVAKPITRLGGPGLIPVSFVEIRDMMTGQPVPNVQEAVQEANIPSVEEWKKTVEEYRSHGAG